MGNTHEANGHAVIDYAFCPPASGRHWNITGFGPIPRNFYGPETEKPPGGWIHDLEHGFVVLAYSCKNGCPSADELARMRQWMDSVPATPNAQLCGVPNKALVVRFDSMTTRFAVLAWDRVLLGDQFDPALATEFTIQWEDNPAAPEVGACVTVS